MPDPNDDLEFHVGDVVGIVAYSGSRDNPYRGTVIEASKDKIRIRHITSFSGAVVQECVYLDKENTYRRGYHEEWSLFYVIKPAVLDDVLPINVPSISKYRKEMGT